MQVRYKTSMTTRCCNTRPVFAQPGQKPAQRCAKHRIEGDVDVVNRLCERCTKHATYGTSVPQRCASHKLPGDVVVMKRPMCDTCKMVRVREGKCWGCRAGTVRARQTEMSVKRALEEAGLYCTSHDRSMPCVESKARPDFVFVSGDGEAVVLEVDEEAHRYYNPQCEINRLQELRGQFPNRLVVVRYNPREGMHSLIARIVRKTVVGESLLGLEMPIEGHVAIEIRDDVAGINIVYVGYDIRRVSELHEAWDRMQREAIEQFNE